MKHPHLPLGSAAGRAQESSGEMERRWRKPDQPRPTPADTATPAADTAAVAATGAGTTATSSCVEDCAHDLAYLEQVSPHSHEGRGPRVPTEPE